ncbi:MAG: Crp/Fnr family transcriptional regulator [Rhizobiaceae bacterium]
MRANLSPADIEAIRSTSMFGGLRQELLDQLTADAFISECDRGEMLFLQGEPAAYFFIVLEGWIKVYRASSAGDEAIVGIFTRGRTFAEAAAFTNGVFPASAEAVTDARILRIPANHLFEKISRSPEIGLAMLASTSIHLHQLVMQIEQLKTHTGAQRVAEFFVSIAPCIKGPCVVQLPYDKSLLAGKLGLKPESLSRAFNRLKEYGVEIDRNKAIISDVRRLENLVETERAEVLKAKSN